ncbi:hypothetical protein [Bifidobacterium sp. SO1]|uniref:hypothetical protein n=1 Tax=Bifidobacterium sp. SO1 TaxID=2809029 RepID=UPI001BDC58A9|nr:hypothetical protein [Bifidobacterium sp. SO1]MBT1162580.1 hypothetical protein [Bifidobacterium sp. SO1]
MLRNTVYEFNADGFDVRIAACPDSFAGYVNLPEDHPWRHSDAGQIPFDVQDGITYGPDEEGWIGFNVMRGKDDAIDLDGWYYVTEDDFRLFCWAFGWREPVFEDRTTFLYTFHEVQVLAHEASEAMRSISRG